MLLHQDYQNALSAIEKVHSILKVNIFSANPNWLSEASFTLMIIHLKDVCQLLARCGYRISAAEDLPEGKDLTDHINDVRNAVCHIGSPLRHLSFGSLSFGAMTCKGTLLSTPEFDLSNPHDDDIAVFYGRHRIFMRRHVWKATEDAVSHLKSIAKANDWKWWDLS